MTEDVEALRARVRRLQAENDDLRALLATLQSSTVWRLTAPLRHVGSRLTLLRRLVRRLRQWQAVQRLRASGLVDGAWYRNRYPDATGDAAWHYLTRGAAEDRDPGPGFSTGFYRRRYPDIGDGNPLLHYLQSGRAEGRLPHPDAITGDDPGADGAVPDVAFVSGDPGSASEDYRVRHRIAFLARAGLNAEAVPLDELARQVGRLARARLLVLFRTPWTPALDALVARARAHGVPVVYDVDDLVFDPDMGTVLHVDGLRHIEPQDRPLFRDRLHRNRQALELTDLCIVSTGSLADHVRAAGKPAVVLANGSDWDMAAAAEAARIGPRPRDGRLRLGYASGTLTHQKDFAVAAPAVARLLAERPEATLTLLGRFLPEEFPELAPFHERIERRAPVPHARLFEELARFDIHLAPLELDNPYCDAKSALKFLHAALLDSPTVASPTPPFVEAIRDGETGMLARTGDDWYAALATLAADGERRAAMGRAARRAALAAFGPEASLQATRRVFDPLLRPLAE